MSKSYLHIHLTVNKQMASVRLNNDAGKQKKTRASDPVN